MNCRRLSMLLGAATLGCASHVFAAPVQVPLKPGAPTTAVDVLANRASPPELVVHRGQRLSEALAQFAKQQGWTVLWYCQDWAAPGRTVFHGDFLPVSQEFIQSIAADGADIHGQWWLGNKTLVVTGSGAMQ